MIKLPNNIVKVKSNDSIKTRDKINGKNSDNCSVYRFTNIMLEFYFIIDVDWAHCQTDVIVTNKNGVATKHGMNSDDISFLKSQFPDCKEINLKISLAQYVQCVNDEFVLWNIAGDDYMECSHYLEKGSHDASNIMKLSLLIHDRSSNKEQIRDLFDKLFLHEVDTYQKFLKLKEPS